MGEPARRAWKTAGVGSIAHQERHDCSHQPNRPGGRGGADRPPTGRLPAPAAAIGRPAPGLDSEPGRRGTSTRTGPPGRPGSSRPRARHRASKPTPVTSRTPASPTPRLRAGAVPRPATGGARERHTASRHVRGARFPQSRSSAATPTPSAQRQSDEWVELVNVPEGGQRAVEQPQPRLSRSGERGVPPCAPERQHEQSHDEATRPGPAWPARWPSNGMPTRPAPATAAVTTTIPGAGTESHPASPAGRGAAGQEGDPVVGPSERRPTSRGGARGVARRLDEVEERRAVAAEHGSAGGSHHRLADHRHRGPRGRGAATRRRGTRPVPRGPAPAAGAAGWRGSPRWHSDPP